MEEPITDTPIAAEKPRGGKRAALFLFIGIILGIAAGGAGAYYYLTVYAPPPAKVVEKVVEKEKAVPKTFKYAPKTSGLSLEIAKTYLIAVKSDGENDGVPGAEFSVVTAETENVLVNKRTGYVNVEVYKQATTIDQQSNKIKLQYQSNGYTNVKTIASKVDNQPAILLTADGPTDSPGATSTYFVRGGEYLYAITATPGTTPNALEDVVEGFKLSAAQ